jgi:hypothetical protein
MLRQLKVGDKEYKLSPKENELLKASLHPQKRFHAKRPCFEKDLEKENYLPQEVWTFILPSFVNY